MNLVYLSLGGNIGDRAGTISTAIGKLNELAGNVKLQSPIYETEAWGVKNQQPYLNCCIYLETELDADKLIQLFLSIENEMGRKRSATQTYEARRIDIDILFFNNEIINKEALTVPHPRLQLRKFVLIPLNDIAPHYLHPVLNKTIFNLLADCNDASAVTLFK